MPWPIRYGWTQRRLAPVRARLSEVPQMSHVRYLPLVAALLLVTAGTVSYTHLGGSFNLARGLMERFIEFGGTFAPQCPVTKIIIEGGRATGIELADGATVRARQFVASSLDVHTTLEDLIGRAQFPAAFQKKLDGFEYTGWTLSLIHI